MRHKHAALLVGAALLAGLVQAPAQPVSFESIDLRSAPIAHFRLGSGETRFGALEFVGGLDLSSRAGEFGQFSALRFLTPGGDFIGVADHGYWFKGRIERDAAGLPAGISGFAMQPMVDRAGAPIADKADKDAEGLEVTEGVATVSFERHARVSEYRIDGASIGGPLRDLDFVIPRHELRYNQGIETLVRAPAGGILAGARIAIAERSIDPEGNIFAAILEGPQKGVFKIRRSGDFDVTDGVFMENGDLLLLERRFSMVTGAAMRLRRIEGDTIRRNALVDGKVLMEANLAYRIDNMEALDIWKRADGETIVSILSDNNQSFLQKTIYLEFRLAE